MQPGRASVVIISGPSGVGKDTIIEAMQRRAAAAPDRHYVITVHHARPPAGTRWTASATTSCRSRTSPGCATTTASWRRPRSTATGTARRATRSQSAVAAGQRRHPQDRRPGRAHGARSWSRTRCSSSSCRPRWRSCTLASWARATETADGARAARCATPSTSCRAQADYDHVVVNETDQVDAHGRGDRRHHRGRARPPPRPPQSDSCTADVIGAARFVEVAVDARRRAGRADLHLPRAPGAGRPWPSARRSSWSSGGGAPSASCWRRRVDPGPGDQAGAGPRPLRRSAAAAAVALASRSHIAEHYLAPPGLVVRAMLPPGTLERIALMRASRPPAAMAGVPGDRRRGRAVRPPAGCVAAAGEAGIAVDDLPPAASRATLLRELRQLEAARPSAPRVARPAATARPRQERWAVLTPAGREAAALLAAGERPAGSAAGCPPGRRSCAELADAGATTVRRPRRGSGSVTAPAR